MRAIRSLFAVALAIACLPASAQFSDTTEVTAVQIPVQVIADGKPVRGLTAADFTVYEGRRQRAVTGFDAVDLQTLPPDAEIPGAARRWFLLVFDLAFSEPNGIDRGREAAIGMLDVLHPSDLVAVATYRRSGVDLVLGFTSDRGQIAAALNSLGLPELIDRSGDPLKTIIVEHDNSFGEELNDGGGAGKEYREKKVKPPPPTNPNDLRLAINLSNRLSKLMDPLFNARKSSEAAAREAQK